MYHISSSCCIRLLQLLLPMACCTLMLVYYSHTLSSSLAHLLAFQYGILQLWTASRLSHSFTCNHKLGILSLCSVFPDTPRRLLPDVSNALRGSLHPRYFHRSLPILFLICPPSLFCCSMANTGNHGEQVCDIHGNLAIRYEPRAAKSAGLHA